MKIRLNIRAENLDAVSAELKEHGIEISDDADLILREANHCSDWLAVRYENEHMHIPADSILYIESLGHDILIHTKDAVYSGQDRLFQLETMLGPDFMRISNSVIIAKKEVIRIRSSLNQVFTLTLSNSDEVRVSRTYYQLFKEEFGI